MADHETTSFGILSLVSIVERSHDCQKLEIENLERVVKQ